MEADEKTIRQVADQLANYVYVLIDPRDSTPFYVGKGVGFRMLHHGIDAAQLSEPPDGESEEASRKIERIRSIHSAGLEPEIWVLRYGMGAEYTAVEAAAIDLLMSLPIAPADDAQLRRVPLAEGQQLTNARREANRGHGITTLEQLVNDLAAPPLESAEPLLLITLARWEELEETVPGGGTRAGYGFKRAWLDSALREQEIQALADSTRCWWGVRPDRVENSGIKHLVAVHGGVTRALFRIVPGTWEELKPKRRGCQVVPVLDGEIYDAVVGPHGRRTPAKQTGDQSQYNYWPRS